MKNKLILGIRLLMVAFGIFFVYTLINIAFNHRANSYTYEVSTVPARQMEKQLACLAKNIYYEAGNEPFEGKVAVAQVTLNRVETGKFADSICGVVYQKTTFLSKTVCQFSWFCENNGVAKPIHKESFKESEEVARMVLLEGMRLPSLKEAVYYHADYVDPKWNKPKIKQIGRHIFYKERV